MINNMISISLDGKPCVSEDYSVLFIYNSINLILIRVERKSLIRKTLILIRVPFVSDTLSAPQGSNPLGPPGPEPMTCGGPSGQRRSTDRDDQRGRGPSRCPPGTDRTRSGPASSIRPFLVSTQLEQDVEVLQGGDIAGGLVAGGDIAQ